MDLSNQLRLFIPEDKDIGIRPERLLSELGETEFIRRHQCPVRSLAAFEKSIFADDWRELMRLYLVRRTRTFIQDNYALTDPNNGRKYLVFEDGTRAYFPSRIPKTVKFKIDDQNPTDQYARLYADDVVDTINHLTLPRYGLGNYVAPTPHEPPTLAEAKVLQDLSRAGKRLLGYCRTGIFKRLESSGQAFIQSVERHILRNHVYLQAIEKGLPLPIGTQDAGLLDTRVYDEDAITSDIFDEENGEEFLEEGAATLRTEEAFRARAADAYEKYADQFKRRFKWLRPLLFVKALGDDLRADATALLKVLQKCGDWMPDKDAKLNSLLELVTKTHANEKVLVFTQFADTVRYLEKRLQVRGVPLVAGVTGESSNPTGLAWRFSPVSNNKRGQTKPEDELRVLIATDVLSEGQNLQDCFVVVNYDLPWAIIRLIQRAGRVDRIGQHSEHIYCYSFLPADGVERIIRLRARVRQRLQENAEVVGADEAFFEDDRNDRKVLDLYNEKSGIFDGEADSEVDLASYAYQIWKNAITKDPKLEETIPALPPVTYATRTHVPKESEPEGVLVYLRTGEGNDALAWINKEGASVTESQFAVLKAAECSPDTPAIPRTENHHELVHKGVEWIVKEEKSVGGQLGRPSGARFRTYERVKRHAERVKGTLFESQVLLQAIDEIYRYPLRSAATDILNRQLRSGISDQQLAELVLTLREDGALCLIEEDERSIHEPALICSMGLMGLRTSKVGS